MLPDERSYDALRRAFRWNVPDRFNLATACCGAHALGAPDRTALIILDEGLRPTPWTYGQLDDAARRLASALRGLGVGQGDRVAILLPQSAEVPIVHLAAWMLGAVTLPLAGLFGPDALAYRLDDSGAVALVSDVEGLAKLEPERARAMKIVLVGEDEGGPNVNRWHDLVDASSPLSEPVATGPDTPAVMVYTSGTTGPPKGALHGHRVLLGHLPGVQMSHEFLPQRGDRLWTPADWAWAGGLFNVLLPGLYFGVPVIAYAARRFDPERAVTLMDRLDVRNVFMPPTAVKLMRGLPSASIAERVRLRTLGSGGESLGRETLEWGREAFGLTINEFYGQTECNYVLSSCAAIGVSRPGAIGKPVPGHTVAIIDPATGEPMAAGAQGDIAVRSPDPVMFLSYWNRPEATTGKFVGDWMTTGDRAYADEDGYVHFVGRDDDVITSAGFRIGPAEIEDCLSGHPAVALSAVVGKPDPIRTERVKAFIRLREGVAASPELADEIAAYVRARLSGHEYPREIAFVDEVPLTTTGKVIRRHFRETARREAEAETNKDEEKSEPAT